MNRSMALRAEVPAAKRALPPDLAARLRCPVCGSRLRLQADSCCCLASGHEFGVVREAPILLDRRTSIFDSPAQHQTKHFSSYSARRLKRLAGKLLPSLGKNIGAKGNYARFADLLLAISVRPRVLVLGGATVGAGLETILGHPSIEFVETDVYPSARTALICDAHKIGFDDETFDGVIVQAVLEHVADPQTCVEEIHRVLKPRGLVYSDTPFMQQVHTGRYDFSRFTHVGHRRLFRKFEEVSSGVTCGPGMALAWAYQYFLLSFVQSKLARAATIAFARLTGFWLKYLDYYLIRKPGAFDAASAYYFLGIKGRLSISDREVVLQYRGSQRN